MGKTKLSTVDKIAIVVTIVGLFLAMVIALTNSDNAYHPIPNPTQTVNLNNYQLETK